MSLLDKYRIDFEYNESYPEILKAIRRAKRARKQRREAQMAKSSQREVSLGNKLHPIRARGNNRKPSIDKKETE